MPPRDNNTNAFLFGQLLIAARNDESEEALPSTSIFPSRMTAIFKIGASALLGLSVDLLEEKPAAGRRGEVQAGSRHNQSETAE